MSLLISQKEFPYHHWECLREDSGDCLRIVPERGGLITSWKCNGREVLYLDQLRFADLSKSVRGGIPVLFPICGDLPDNKIIFENKEYLLPQHGFARDSYWKLNAIDDKSGVILSLSETNSSLLCYPFQFDLEMEIKLKNNILEIITRIKNNSHRIMPFSFGLHPYFEISNLNQVKFLGLPDDCINQKTMMQNNTNKELEGLSKGVDLISGPNTSTKLFDLKDRISLEMITKEPFDLNVIWTDPPRNMVCLEPWTSPRKSLLNGERTIKLKHGQIQQLYCKFIFNQFI